MGEDEVGTVRTLIAYRAVMREAIASHNGRVVDSPGDNLLADLRHSPSTRSNQRLTFSSPFRSVTLSCLKDGGSSCAYGVNFGDVMAEGDHIFGDAVNIAARLEGWPTRAASASPRKSMTRWSLKLSLTWESLGENSS